MSIRLLDTLQAGFLDGSGQPLANGTVTVYDAGTTNLRTVFQEYALATAHANPIVLDDEGKATAFSDRRVKFVVRNAAGASLLTIDNVGSASADYLSASATGLAGNGLIAPGDGTLAVGTDGVGIEVSSDQVRLKDAGVVTAKIADANVTAAKLAANAVNSDNAPGIIGASLIGNVSIATSVAANALTVALKTAAGADATTDTPIAITFRSSTAASGLPVTRKVTAALSVVVSSGSTLGHASATETPIYVYAIDNAGTVELAVSSTLLEERTRQTTVAEGGGGAADSSIVMYSTTARSNVGVRLIAILTSNQTTAGTWAAVPTTASAPYAHPLGVAISRPTGTTVPVGGVGISATCNAFSTSSTTPVDVTNLAVTITVTGRPVYMGLIPDGSGVRAEIAATEDASPSSNINGQFLFLRGSTELSRAALFALTVASQGCRVPPGSLWMIDASPPPGTYTYKLQVALTGTGNTVEVTRCKLVVWEM